MGAPAKSKHLPQGIKIVHEDATLIVVDKAPGLLTIGTEKERINTVYFRLTDWVRKGNTKSRNRVFIVHRLDRETSGLLVIAKTFEAKSLLQDHWDETEKKYYAVVQGNLSQTTGRFSSYLYEGSALKVHSTRDPREGKIAHTDYRVVKEIDGRSLLELTLLTGRKHQIRVHLAEAGYPILGDDKYGPAKQAEKRLALHAFALRFNHPATGQRMEFETKLPAHFERLMLAATAGAAKPAPVAKATAGGKVASVAKVAPVTKPSSATKPTPTKKSALAARRPR
jgi:RluA family pseudouridine synthase